MRKQEEHVTSLSEGVLELESLPQVLYGYLTTTPPQAYSLMSYLCSQQPGQVDLRDHLAASVALPLIRVVVVLYQMPQFGSTLQVRSDHGCSGP